MMIQRNIVRGALLAGVLTGCAGAQTLEKVNFGNASLMAASTPVLFSSSVTAAESSDSALPEAPSATVQELKKLQKGDPNAAPAAARDTTRSGVEAPPYTKYIPAGYVTHRQTVREKEITGAQDLYSVGNFGGIFLSAGYSHWRNSMPNYGTDKGAFGQRLGASAIRTTTQGIFTDMVFSPLLKQDLRYYVKGQQYGIFTRTAYAVSRVVVARRDSHSTRPNTALFAGYAATAALEAAYYPKQNRNFGDLAGGYASSLGGAALGNIFSEFQTDIEVWMHLKKKP